MENKKLEILIYIVIGLLVVNILITWNGRSIYFDNSDDSLQNVCNDLNIRLSELGYFEDEIQHKLDMQNSIIDDFKIKHTKVNADKLTGTEHIEVTLKEYSKKSNVTVTVGKNSMKMQYKKGKFECDLDTPLQEIRSTYQIEVDDDGKIKSEVINLYDDRFEEVEFYPWEDVLSFQLENDDVIEPYDWGCENNELSIGTFSIKVAPLDNSGKNPVVKAIFGDKEVVADVMLNKGNSYKVKFPKKIPLDKKLKKIKIVAYYEGKSGLLYQATIAEAEVDDGITDWVTYADDEMEVDVYTPSNKKLKFTEVEE